MTRPILLMPAARLEVIAAHEWYEKEAAGLGQRFLRELNYQAERIVDNPMQFALIRADIRRARLRRFPYALFFRTQDEAINVIACFHASRDPMIWRRRL